MFSKSCLPMVSSTTPMAAMICSQAAEGSSPAKPRQAKGGGGRVSTRTTQEEEAAFRCRLDYYRRGGCATPLTEGLEAGRELAVVQGVVQLGEQVAQGTQHGHTAVLQLHGAVAVQRALVLGQVQLQQHQPINNSGQTQCCRSVCAARAGLSLFRTPLCNPPLPTPSLSSYGTCPSCN